MSVCKFGVKGGVKAGTTHFVRANGHNAVSQHPNAESAKSDADIRNAKAVELGIETRYSVIEAKDVEIVIYG